MYVNTEDLQWKKSHGGGNVYVMVGCLWNPVPSLILMEAAGCTMQVKPLLVPHVGNLLCRGFEQQLCIKKEKGDKKLGTRWDETLGWDDHYTGNQVGAAQVNSNTKWEFLFPWVTARLLSDINRTVLIYLPRGVTKVTDHRLWWQSICCVTPILHWLKAKGHCDESVATKTK